MSTRQSSDPTVFFYDQNSAEFARCTANVDMSHLYEEFLPYLPAGGRILDAGCGSGRDALYFKRQGYVVCAFDASFELAAIASRAIEAPVRVMGFLDVDSDSEFDGIWACASLLHVPADNMDEVVNRLTRALKPRGALYASFKYGAGQGIRNGRFFNDYDEEKFQKLLDYHPGLRAEKIWKTNDSRPENAQQLWLNAILTKQGSVRPSVLT